MASPSPDAKLLAAAIDNLTREVKKMVSIAAVVAEQLNTLKSIDTKEKTDDK